MKNKTVRIRLVISLAVISGVLLTAVFSEAVDKPEVRIWVNKNQFFVYEPTLVHYEIKNVSDSTLLLALLREEHFVITDNEGKTYQSHLKGTSMGVDHLKPGESRYGGVDICRRYGVASIGEYSCHLDLAPPAQIYPAPYERTKSNTIKIEVIEPEGDEKKALDIFREAEKLKYSRDRMHGGRDLKKADLSFLKYQQLVNKYPTSVYAALSLDCALGVYEFSANLEERRKIIPVCTKLIENYPNSLYFASAFSSLADVYQVVKDKEGAIKIMHELIEKHPDTGISERAEYWLEKIEKWEF